MNWFVDIAVRSLVPFAFAYSLLLTGCADSRSVSIGFSIDDLRIERLRRERDGFVLAAKRQGASVKVRSADGDPLRQIEQIEGLIEQKPQVLVILPLSPDVMKASVEKAKRAGVKVIAYDRLITNADIDAYISFDNECVGARLAESSTTTLKKEESTPGLLTTAKDWFHSIASLGDKAKSGQENQDSNLDACKRIFEGDSVITVYKPMDLIASEAAKIAIELAKGESVRFTHQVNNGFKSVDALLLASTVVSREIGVSNSPVETSTTGSIEQGSSAN